MDVETGKEDVFKDGDERIQSEEIYTKIVRAGKRTYFFDVKVTKTDDYYLNITESKKRLGKDGKMIFEKHKIFLYKEDFGKFEEGLKHTVSYIENLRNEKNPKTHSKAFTDVNFDDLGK